MLANHVLFWNTRALSRLRGEKPGPAPSNNEETFNSFDAATWNKTVHDLADVEDSRVKPPNQPTLTGSTT